MEKKLSFIFPIYNVEAYLPQCLDSVLEQATEDCELILVDDGAKDSSGAICDQYAAKYPNIQVIHKPNGGLSSARNAGMEPATGRYVCFIDSDDYIAEGTVEKLLAWIDGNGADVCFLQTTKVYPDGTVEPMGDGIVRSEIQGKTQKQVLSFLSQCPKFPGSAWGKLYKREFLLKNRLHFPDDRRLSEDLMYTLDVLLAAESFDCLEFPFYCYRQARAGSITANVNARYYFDTALFVTECAERFAKDKKAVDETAACALSFAAYEYSILLWHLLCLDGEDADRAYRFLQDYRWVLKYGRAAKTKLVRTAAGILGLRGAAKLLDLYMNNRK